jgi:ectoine hydroxylase
MLSLGKIFRQYTGYLRGQKWVYVINNLLNRKKLLHNKDLYPKFGLKQSIYAPVGSHLFPEELPPGQPWLDQPDALDRLTEHPEFATFSPDTQEQIRNFVRDGYLVLRNFYNPDQVKQLNQEVDRLLDEQKTGFNYTQRKVMDAYQESDLIDKKYFRNPEMLHLLSFLMGKKVIPFQTIHFIEGSEQLAHSDFIHMTTAPLGYLIATWTALEPITEENGALFYYPGSHRLPYVTCQNYPSGNTRWQIGANSYKKYEEKVQEVIQENGLKKETFIANPGDVLVWHANLLHGGSRIQKKEATRRSMVAHYFCEGVICYHEISQRPALIEPLS